MSFSITSGLVNLCWHQTKIPNHVVIEAENIYLVHNCYFLHLFFRYLLQINTTFATQQQFSHDTQNIKTIHQMYRSDSLLMFVSASALCFIAQSTGNGPLPTGERSDAVDCDSHLSSRTLHNAIRYDMLRNITFRATRENKKHMTI